MMNKSREVQQQYMQLRSKVQGRIRQLQGKLSSSNTHSNSNHCPSGHHTHLNHSHCHHSHCHSHNSHLQHSHYVLHSQPPQTAYLSPSYPNNAEMAHSQVQVMSRKESKNNNHTVVNQLISEALVQSLQNQRLINDNIKAINQKIQNISVQQNRSYLSEGFSQSVTKRKKQQNNIQKKYTQLINIESDRQACYSEVKTDSEHSNQYQINSHKSQTHINLKKSKSKPKENGFNSITTKRTKKRNQKNKSLSANKFKSQYFLSFGCPMHSPSRVTALSPQSQEIYKDSQHRNRKHEKDHLLKAWHQQQKSKKELLQKIAYKAFHQYGKN